MPLLQNESSCKTFHMKMNLMSLHENKRVGELVNFFDWFRTKLFLTEARGNSEMACFVSFRYNFPIVEHL